MTLSTPPRPTRRTLLAGALAAPIASLAGSGSPAAAASRVFTPEMFGAKGDGRTNDTRAMNELATAVNIAGGGTIVLRKTTYLVGSQGTDNSAKNVYRYEPAKLLELVGCTRPISIQGNGARIRCADGLRYGAFDADGAPMAHTGRYIGPGLASPYSAMIAVQGCSGPITIADLELDGNVNKLKIGGTYGDTGWQIPAIGLMLRDNAGVETVSNVYSHHHAYDGLYIMGLDPAPSTALRRRLVNVRAEYNGRQGCSIVSGHGYVFQGCSFNHTGRGPIASKPGAGVDVEAEGGRKNSGFQFIDCQFVDNVGPGFVADTGPSSDVTFTMCRFVGTTSWSVWPNKPGIRFNKCSFTGALARAYGDPDRARATRFDDCTFDDDPVHSPTGQVYGGTNTTRPLADLSNAMNIQFDRCRFLATHGGVMPWSKGAVYIDCTMVQTTPKLSFPRGAYEGHTVATGQISPTFSTISGTLILNGKPFR